jgi:hypothetical protein
MIVSVGLIWNILVHHWYITLPALALIIGGIVALILRRRHGNKQKVSRKEVLAIIIDGNIRSSIYSVLGDEIKDFSTLRPRIIRGKKVYLLQPLTAEVKPVKPSGNGEHAETKIDKVVAAKGKGRQDVQ